MNLKKYFCLLGFSAITLGTIETAEAMNMEPWYESVDNDAARLKEMKHLRRQCSLRSPKATEKEIEKATNFVTMLALQRKGNYAVSGGSIYNKKITLQNVRDIAKAVRALGVAAYEQGGEAQEYLDLLLDFLSSQKAYDRFPTFKYSNYTDIRKVPADFLGALSSCDETRQQNLIKGVQKLLEWDVICSDDQTVRDWVSSDYLYNVIPYMYACAVLNPDKEQGIKDMERFSHFIDLCTQYNVGGKDLLKPDGTGFHHKTHYNGYMYSYRTWVDYMYKLKGTSFRISKDGYMRMRKAVVSEYLMAVRSKNDEGRCTGNSMAGRHPFKGMSITFEDKSLQQLIEVGGDVLGTKIDEELASYYNAFYMTNKYKGIEPARLDGYYQFNYSPAGVYRQDNWLAVMRCPTAKFWGGELYNKTNRFGRYQSHGTLEIIYEGGLDHTGYPSDMKKKGAGWDWNMMPGSTTVHYTDWNEMLPNKNNADRFDQWAKTTTFAGAVSGGDFGLFAAAFDQSDHWGSQRFEPTNLTFCKSVLAVDGMLFSMGNGISAHGNYPDWITATNLFQSVISGVSKDLVVNGEKMDKGADVRLASDRAVTLLAPTTTGYYIPAGHDEIVVKYAEQESHMSTGITKNSLGKEMVVKAYINHGVKTSGKDYRFVVVPAANADRMNKIAKDYEAGRLFDVAVMQDSLHIIKYLPKSVIAYSFFRGEHHLSVGNVVGSDTELLLMERETNGELYLNICNPNLRPVDDGKKGWFASETKAVIELKGNWKLKSALSGVTLESSANGNTLLKTTLKDGLKLDVVLVKQ